MQVDSHLGPGATIVTSALRSAKGSIMAGRRSKRRCNFEGIRRSSCSNDVIADFNDIGSRNTFRDRLCCRLDWSVAVILYRTTSAEVILNEANAFCDVENTSLLNDVLAVSQTIKLTVCALAKPCKFEFTAKQNDHVDVPGVVQTGDKLLDNRGRQIGSISMFLFGTNPFSGESAKYALTTSHNSSSGSTVHTAERPVIGTVKKVFLDDNCQKPLDGREVDVIMIRLLGDVDVRNTAILDGRTVQLTGYADRYVDGQPVVKFRDDDRIGTDVSTGVVSYLAIDVFDKNGDLEVGGPDVAFGVVSQNDESKPFHFPGESGTLLISKPTAVAYDCSDGVQTSSGVAILYARIELDVVDRRLRGQTTSRKRFVSVAKPIQPIIERITGEMEFADVSLFPKEENADSTSVLSAELLEMVLIKTMLVMLSAARLSNTLSAESASSHRARSLNTLLGVCSEWSRVKRRRLNLLLKSFLRKQPSVTFILPASRCDVINYEHRRDV